MKYKQILIIISIVLIGSQKNVYSQNSNTINSINIQTDTLYDFERKYKPPPNGFNINTNFDSLEFTERKIPKVRRIFKAGKTYHYKALYLNSNNDTLSNRFVLMKTTGERWEWQPMKQDLIYYEFPDYKTDSIKLSNHDINKEIQHWNSQTGEGVIENIEEVWMHPIRINQYKFTEIAPFPQVKFPLEKSRIWYSQKMIDEGWGEWNGQTIINTYKIAGQTTIKLNDLQIDCWIIKGTAKCQLGNSKLTTYFNEEYGFVKMEYQNYENERLVFQLIKLEQK